MDSHYYILLSNNHDKYYEYFWLTFKDSIYKKVPTSIQDNFTNCSKLLNQLQAVQNYDRILEEINDFIELNINHIIGFLYSIQEYGMINLTRTNIHRFMKIYPLFKLKSVEYAIISVLISYEQKDYNPKFTDLYDLTHKYFKNCIKYKKYNIGCMELSTQIDLEMELYYIINECIQIQYIALINNLSEIVDMTYFYKPEIENIAFYKHTKAPKLFKIIEQKYPDEIIIKKYPNTKIKL